MNFKNLQDVQEFCEKVGAWDRIEFLFDNQLGEQFFMAKEYNLLNGCYEPAEIIKININGELIDSDGNNIYEYIINYQK